MKSIKVLLAFFTIFILSTTSGRSQTSVSEAFVNIKKDNKPWCFWYWMHGCVSKKGIKADLKAMSEAGLGGTYLMPIRGKVSPSKYEPVVEQLTPEWWEMVRFTLEEAKKLKLEIAMHICDGFALAGGPWITPEKSMQKLVWTETYIKGGKKLKLSLKQPETNLNFYKEIAVLAVPMVKNSELKDPVPVEITSSDTIKDLRFLVDDKKGSLRGEDSAWIVYKYEKPFLCRTVVTEVNGRSYQCHRFKIEVSDDGKNYRHHTNIETPRHGWQNTGFDVTHSIPPVKARYFRFKWTKEGSAPGAEDMDNAKWKPVLNLTGLTMSSKPRIHNIEGKNASVWRLSSSTTNTQLPEGTVINADKVVDITSFVNSEGLLEWKAPKGNWTILRMGHTTTGITNSTGGAGAGLECDKFSSESVKIQFDNWFGKAVQVAGDAFLSDVLSTMHIDSWECGSQNWSENFAAEFEKRRGYSLMKFLPVMAGIPLDSPEKTEQVLYDVRETVAELVNDVFFTTFTKFAHSKGCKVTAECVAPTMMSDGMLHFKTVDIPMGEFWYDSPTHDKPNDMLDAITGAHIYGKNIVKVEGFTQLRTNWVETPATHKTLLDRNFALGMNKLSLHVFTHNPFIDRKPGMTLSGMGLYFQRDQTWIKPGRAWIDYITRCQALLQLGKPVVDIAVFGGLELPRRSMLPDRLVPFLPGIVGEERVEKEKIRLENKGVPMTESPFGVNHTATIPLAEEWVDALRGYNYDTFNPDVLFNMSEVDEARIKLDGGMTYQILVVPQVHPMSPDRVSPNIKGEQQLKNVIKDFKSKGVNVLYESKLPWIKPDFSELGIKRDFEVFENGKEAFGSVAWTHRHGDGFDIYFVANQITKTRDLELIFRVDGKIPELYDAVTGKISEVRNWTISDGRTKIKLKLEPNQSMFVVFEKLTNLKSSSKNDPIINVLPLTDLNENWSVSFDTAFGGPSAPVKFNTLTPWNLNQDYSVKHYSGTAVYTKSLTLNSEPEKDKVYMLDLGKVSDIAEVFINGVYCGTAWTFPYSVDISGSIKKGINNIEIKVTNTWVNRIEADDKLPLEKRVTWTDGNYRKRSRELVNAGLTGPLNISSIKY